MFYCIENYENNYNLYCKNKFNLGVSTVTNILRNININYDLFKQIILKHNGMIVNDINSINNERFKKEFVYFKNKLDADECTDELNIILKLLGG